MWRRNNEKIIEIYLDTVLHHTRNISTSFFFCVCFFVRRFASLNFAGWTWNLFSLNEEEEDSNISVYDQGIWKIINCASRTQSSRRRCIRSICLIDANINSVVICVRRVKETNITIGGFGAIVSFEHFLCTECSHWKWAKSRYFFVTYSSFSAAFSPLIWPLWERSACRSRRIDVTPTQKAFLYTHHSLFLFSLVSLVSLLLVSIPLAFRTRSRLRQATPKRISALSTLSESLSHHFNVKLESTCIIVHALRPMKKINQK